MVGVPYTLAVQRLVYEMVYTKPNIVHAIGGISRFVENTIKENCKAFKWILKYLRRTTKDCLCFERSDPILK